MFRRQVDMRPEPISRMVALGESTTLGASVSSREKCWVSVVHRLLQEWQGSPIECVNQGIGSNVITKECPAYWDSVGPCALDRVDAEVIGLNPDLVLLSYGLNDSRGGTTPAVFRRAYQQLIDRIRAKIDPVIVLVNVYYMHEVCYTNCQNWEESDYEATDVFNLVIEQFAEQNRAILADVYSAEVGVDWIVDEDHCHANDLGHTLIGHRVFEAIVRHCSFPACRRPKDSLMNEFVEKYGMGPERPFVERTDKEPPKA